MRAPIPALVMSALTMVFPLAAIALLPPAEVECCYRKDFDGAQCRRFELTADKCDRSIANWNETYRRIQAVNNAPAKPASDAEPGKDLPVTQTRAEIPASNAPTDGTARQFADPAIAAAPEKIFRGKYFEVRYPADFVAKPLMADKPADADAATFTAPGGQMQFYVYSPQWAGDAPGIALDATREKEAARKVEAGRSSGVAGTFTWTTLVARDGSYTRSYQAFGAADNSIHWVIGMKFASEADRARHQTRYAKFKASLRQFAD